MKLFTALAAAAVAATTVALPMEANAGFQSGRLAGYPASAYDGGATDVLQVRGPRGIISIAVTCGANDWVWVGNHGDGPIADAAARDWCF